MWFFLKLLSFYQKQPKKRCCFISVDPATTASPNGACIFERIREEICEIMMWFHNCAMIKDKRKKIHVFLFALQRRRCFSTSDKAINF